MAKQNEKNISGVTVKGKAKWVNLVKPDTKFKECGEYKITLLLPPSEATPLQKIIDDAITAAVAEAKTSNPKLKTVKRADPPYKKDVDEVGEETGLIAFNFKAKASGMRKKDNSPWTFRPQVFDSKNKPLPKDVSVWGGSVVKVAYELRPFGSYSYSPTVGAGVSLGLKAVQVLELVTGGGGRSAAAFGFGEEEGYEGAEPSAEGEDAAGSETGDGTDF